jgi:hypothetical protein
MTMPSDASGQLAFENLRFTNRHGKVSCPVRPSGDPDGSWIIGTLNAGEFMREGPGENWYPFKAKQFEQWSAVKERKSFPAALIYLYRFPDLLKANAGGKLIVITDDEEMADLLRSEDLTATCVVGGMRYWQELYDESFKNATEVVLLPNGEPQGRWYAEQIAQRLTSVAKKVRVAPPAGNGAIPPSAADTAIPTGNGAAPFGRRVRGDRPMVWRSADADHPVTAMAEAPQRADDGRMHQRVRAADGRESYVPADELVASVAPAPGNGADPLADEPPLSGNGATGMSRWMLKRRAALLALSP